MGNKAPCGQRICSSCGSVAFKTVTRGWGSLRITAHPGFVYILDKVFTDMKRENPSLLSRIGSRGGVCCRLVRRSSGGCASSWSNHAFGMAVDLKVDNYNDAHGDRCIHKPLFDVWNFMKRHGVFWGMAFGTEDA